MSAPIRLLVVDDEERIRRLLLEYLEDFEDVQARGAASAEEGLQSLAEWPADLCVVDMRLPGMNGESFIQNAVKDGLCGSFILHTGSVDLALSPALRQLGLDDKDVFIKPADMDRVLARIREVLASRRG